MKEQEPTYLIGTMVIINETHRKGEIGYIDKVKEIIFFDVVSFIYYVKFKDGSVSSFSEKTLEKLLTKVTR